MRRLLPLLLIFSACATTIPAPQCVPGNVLINASLWEQSAAEFQASSQQVYSLAKRELDAALADTSRVGALEEQNEDPSQPPAIITDIDETAIDNTAFEARMVHAGITYDSKAWKQWVSEGAGKAMPGAKEFLDYAHSRGVTIFYVTNRDEDERAGTMLNIANLNYPVDPNVQTLLLRKDTSDKSPRRRDVAAKYRVVMLLGDDVNDFANLRDASWADRDAFVKKMQDWWGTRWFILPNPMYGSWERAAIGTGGTPCEQMERKVQALKP